MSREQSGATANGTAAPSVLFVCLGNICRSPLAQLALTVAAEQAGLAITVDSAGTGDWHVGLPPDRRARAVARRQGHSIDHYRARQLVAEDYGRFDHIIALDGQNLTDLQRLRPAGSRAQLSMLLDHVPGRGGEAVLDPYYLPDDAFEETWEEVQAGAAGLVAALMPPVAAQPD